MRFKQHISKAFFRLNLSLSLIFNFFSLSSLSKCVLLIAAAEAGANSTTKPLAEIIDKFTAS